MSLIKARERNSLHESMGQQVGAQERKVGCLLECLPRKRSCDDTNADKTDICPRAKEAYVRAYVRNVVLSGTWTNILCSKEECVESILIVTVFVYFFVRGFVVRAPHFLKRCGSTILLLIWVWSVVDVANRKQEERKWMCEKCGGTPKEHCEKTTQCQDNRGYFGGVLIVFVGLGR